MAAVQLGSTLIITCDHPLIGTHYVSWLPLRLCSEVSCTLSYLKEVCIAVSSVHIHGSHHNLAQCVPHLPLSLTSAMQHGSSMIISTILWNRLSFNLSHKFLAQWPH